MADYDFQSIDVHTDASIRFSLCHVFAPIQVPVSDFFHIGLFAEEVITTDGACFACKLKPNYNKLQQKIMFYDILF